MRGESYGITNSPRTHHWLFKIVVKIVFKILPDKQQAATGKHQTSTKSQAQSQLSFRFV